MCGRRLFQSKTLACNSLFMSLIPMDEISAAKFRLTSALGRQSQRPGWVARGCTAVPGPAGGGRSVSGRSSTQEASPYQAGRREEPAAAHTVEGAGCSVSLQAKQMNRKQFPGWFYAPRCFGVYYRGWGGKEWLMVCVLWESQICLFY